MKFRKKPIVIEAVRVCDVLSDTNTDWSNSPEWVRVALLEARVISTGKDLIVPTLEGAMIACKEDWLIKGVKGELYPCKPDIFELTYEPFETKD